MSEAEHEAAVTEPVIIDNPAESRFEPLRRRRAGRPRAVRGRQGRPPGWRDNQLPCNTEVADRFQGMGLASKLARGVLDEARARGLAVLPYCPYIKSWIAKHPD